MENCWESKSALILGCGYVGSAVGEVLAKQGARVTVLTRNKERASAAEAWAAQVIQADLDSAAWHSDVDHQQDYVLNCVSSAGGGLEGYQKSYINGMNSVVRWCSGAEVGTYVYTSATSVYPQSDGERVAEDDVPADLTANGAKLREAEQIIEAQTGAWARAFILRLGAIYGPTRHHLLDALKRGETVFAGEGDFYLNYIHLDDIVQAILASFAAPKEAKGGVFNIVDGSYPTKREVVEWLAEQLGVEPPTFDPNLRTARASMRKTGSGKLPHRRVCNERFSRELDWSPSFPTFREGYARLF
ncbi:MAG: NAD-dependent epimerase/dehydratase family protein [Verrucomicrobiota bacterium]